MVKAKYDPIVYVRLRDKGMTYDEIANYLGDVSETSVRRGLRKVGYTKAPPSDVRSALERLANAL